MAYASGKRSVKVISCDWKLNLKNRIDNAPRVQTMPAARK
jgi:hypothetical protein